MVKQKVKSYIFVTNILSEVDITAPEEVSHTSCSDDSVKYYINSLVSVGISEKTVLLT